MVVQDDAKSFGRQERMGETKKRRYCTVEESAKIETSSFLPLFSHPPLAAPKLQESGSTFQKCRKEVIFLLLLASLPFQEMRREGQREMQMEK